MHPVLNILTVFEIILLFWEKKNWVEVLQEAIPNRKILNHQNISEEIPKQDERVEQKSFSQNESSENNLDERIDDNNIEGTT